MIGTKNDTELACYKYTLEYAHLRLPETEREYFFSLFPNDDEIVKTEKPDFVVNSKDKTYLIEHFMVDYCYDGPNKNQSKSRLASRQIMDIYKRYHDPEIGTVRTEEMDNAVQDIQVAINNIINTSMNFDYGQYVKAFERVFTDHYQRIATYVKNEKAKSQNLRIGFLIEFRCSKSLLDAYIGGHPVFRLKAFESFPMTRDIIEIIRHSKQLDFVVISQFNEGAATEASDVKLYEPRNIEVSLERQHIAIYDSVDYLRIPQNIKLNLERNNLNS